MTQQMATPSAPAPFQRRHRMGRVWGRLGGVGISNFHLYYAQIEEFNETLSNGSLYQDFITNLTLLSFLYIC